MCKVYGYASKNCQMNAIICAIEGHICLLPYKMAVHQWLIIEILQMNLYMINISPIHDTIGKCLFSKGVGSW